MKLFSLLIAGLTLLGAQEITQGVSPYSCSKPTGYVTMEYNVSKASINQQIPVSIALKSDKNSRILSYKIVVDEGLENEINAKKIEHEDHDELVIDANVVAYQEDTYFITIYTEAYSIYESKNIRHKSLLVPVGVGTKKRIKRSRQTTEGENLIIFKGMESIQ